MSLLGDSASLELSVLSAQLLSSFWEAVNRVWPPKLLAEPLGRNRLPFAQFNLFTEGFWLLLPDRLLHVGPAKLSLC